jgi:exodeoxyribonuclease VII large subunit
VWVEGEISNVSRPASGHVYFTLKDSGASLRCVMWKAGAARLGLGLQDGAAVAVHGRIGVYEAGGQYQLYTDQIRPVGEGALYQEFLRLKTALEVEGLFAAERKRPIPALPARIGVVTSPTGAALRDVLHTLRRRLPLAAVTLAASSVQGDEAPDQLVQAIAALNRLEPPPDVILLVRGGGSIEDLWAFSDERVVRAVAASEVPIVCGVGHETDFSLSDFAADLRAATPTAAAEMATATTVQDLQKTLSDTSAQLTSSVTAVLAEYRNSILADVQEMRFHSPTRRIQADRQRLDDLARRAEAGETHRLALASSELDGLGRRLTALSPLQVLARGFAVVTRQADGALVSKTAQARGGIRVRVSDGEFSARVTNSPSEP